MAVRGVKGDFPTVQRWVFMFSPLPEKQFNKSKKTPWLTRAYGPNVYQG